MHGDGGVAGPLLIIAGAGSGKTNTLAHRVAHLIVNGADPRRILLMTFSRRAAAEMTRRVERIAGEVLGRDAAVVTDALTWAGTFHGIGARLLRDYALEIGLDPGLHHPRPRGFRRPDEPRPPRARLLEDREPLSDQGHLPRHLFARGQCAGAARRGARRRLSRGASAGRPSSSSCSPPMSRPSRRRTCSITTTCCSTGPQMAAEPALAEHLGARFDHILVDEYQDTNRLQASILLGAEAGRARPDGGRRRRAVDLFLPRRRGPQHPRFPDAVRAAGRDRHARPQLSLDRDDPRRRQRGDRRGRASASPRTSGPSAGRPERPRLVTVRDEADQANYVCEQVLEEREAGTLLKAQAVLFRASHHSGPLEIELTRRNIPFVKFGGLKFLDAAHVKDMLAVLRFAENPRDRVAGFRVLQLLPGHRPVDRRRRSSRRWKARSMPALGLSAFRAPQRAEPDWPAFVELFSRLRARSARLAGRPRTCRGSGTSRIWSASTRTPRSAAPTSLQLEQIAAGYPSRERFLTELTLDPPDATSDQAGPPHLDEDYLILSTIHSAKGQEWKNVFVLNAVDGCIPADLGAGTTRRDRGGAAAALRRDDAGQGRAAPRHAAALLSRTARPARGDRHVYASRTRFIPASILDHFESCTWPRQARAGRGRPARACPHRPEVAHARHVAVRALFPSPLVPCGRRWPPRSAAEGRSDEGCWPSTGIDEIVSRSRMFRLESSAIPRSSHSLQHPSSDPELRGRSSLRSEHRATFSHKGRRQSPAATGNLN